MISLYFSEAYKSLKREKGASLITVFAIVISIFICTMSIVSIFLSTEFNKSLIEKFTVSLFLNDGIPQENKTAIKNFLENKKWINKINFIDKEKAKQIFIKETGEDFGELLEINPLPESFQITLNSQRLSIKDFDVKIKELNKINGINDIIYDYEFILKLFKFISSIQIFLFIFSFFTVFLSLYLIYSTNRLIYKSRVEIYNIMKLVGARLISIKMPIYLNGSILSMISITICLIIVNFLLLGLTNLFNIVNFTRIIIIINVVIPILGLSFGILGGVFSTKNINLNIERV
ncbi:MAG: permease-like cell division protein FtsX [bacterium]